jgi:hypothetical protein
MNDEQKRIVVPFGDDMTKRISCRAGDFLVWIGCPGIFAATEQKPIIHDVWEMREGDFATVTNREDDLPNWFELHPTEVSNSLAYKMMERLNNGYAPGPITEAPNLWRIRAGDRLAWVGNSRPGVAALGHILSLFDFRQSALVYGETNRKRTMEELLAFGSISDEGQKSINADKCHEAVEFVRTMGAPRIMATGWTLG